MVHAALLRLGHHMDLDDVERAVSFFLVDVDFAAIPYFKLLQQINASCSIYSCVTGQVGMNRFSSPLSSS